MKKLIALALCATMTVGSIIGANAAGIKENTAVKVLDSKLTLSDNTLNVFTYNLSTSATGGVLLKGVNKEKEIRVNFSDCIGKKVTVPVPSNDIYTRYLTTKSGYGGNVRTTYSFANTGGEYVKVKVKLSEISSYFNNDGTHTQTMFEDTHNYNFKYEKVGNDWYESWLYFNSGGAVTGVAPDKDGYAEIYISTNIGEETDFCTDFACGVNFSVSSGGGSTGTTVYMLSFGNIDLKYNVDVNDVTALQQYLSNKLELDSLQYFYADINRDGVRDVRDVTALQKGIAKK